MTLVHKQRSTRKGLGAELEVCTGDGISETEDTAVRELAVVTKTARGIRKCCLFERVETFTWT